MPSESLSYVERQADHDLLEALRAGEFCHVLTARQMGKSSLMVRTAARLREAGVAVAVLDLTAVGQNLSADQWYDGLLALLGRMLQLEDELEDFWLEHERLSPLQRWMAAIGEVALKKISGPIVLFIDEIDAVRSLPFSADEFFAAIRECYNRRTEDPQYGRLTFCLLGVATPSDLIRDTRTTPFNIGRRIALNDFTLNEAGILTVGLQTGEPDLPGRPKEEAETLLARILYWTDGHPYLTQRLCLAVARAQAVRSLAEVDEICDSLFLSPGARERDDNLLFVRDRMLRSEVQITGLLGLYRQVHVRKPVKDDEASPLVAVLQLSGITRSVRGLLQPRNRIYYRVFDLEWIRLNMPDAELRRQREAYRRGAVRATLVSTAMLTVLGALAVSAVQSGKQAWRKSGELRSALIDLKRALSATEEQRRLGEERLELMNVAAGERLMDEGDLFAALPWYTEALRLAHVNGRNETIHRLRLASTWQQAPRLSQMWSHPGGANSVEFSPDGQRLLTAGHDGTAGVFEVSSGRPLIPRLKHGGAIRRASFSPDGRKVVTAGADGTARVWDAATGEPLASPQKHAAAVRDACFSPDGRRIITASLDGTARIWDAATGAALSPPLRHPKPVQRASFSPDGQRAITLCAANMPEDNVHSVGGEARVWDAIRGRLLSRIQKQGAGTLDAAYSPDGRRILTAGVGGVAQLWDSITFNPVGQPMRHGDWVWSARFSHDGRWIVTSSADAMARIWDATSGAQTGVSVKHRGDMECAVFSPNGRRIVTASEEGTARVWDARTGEALCAPLRHVGRVNQAVFSPDELHIVTASGDGVVRLWNLAGCESPAAAVPSQNRARFSPDGYRYATADARGFARVWDARTSRPTTALMMHGVELAHIEFSPDGRYLVTATGRIFGQDVPVAKIWNSQTGFQAVPPLQHRGAVRDAAFSPNGRQVLTASEDGTARIWDSRTGLPLIPPWKHGAAVLCARFSPDGSHIITGCRDGSVRIWSLSVASSKRLMPQHHGSVVHAEFSPDGRRVLTASYDGTALVWDPLTGRQLVPPLQHRGGLWGARFSHDGRRIVTAGYDGTARIWDTESGRPITAPLKHGNAVIHAEFSPDGCCVVTASWDNTARVWDVVTGQAVTPPLKHHDRVQDAAFSPDGSRLITASQDGTVRIWQLRPDERPLDELIRQAHLMAGSSDSPAGIDLLEASAIYPIWQSLHSR